MRRVIGAALIAVMAGANASAQGPAKLPAYKQEVDKGVDEMAKLAQEMVDSVFSFGELGFQEVETSRYLTGQLEKYGFTVQRGVAGIPTAWVAKWGSGKPVIALGSDIDAIPQASQKPGVAYPDPILAGAPGHGEGHNTGMPLNVVAAIAVKRIMERDKLPGTIMLWPGVAEEQLATKADPNAVVRPEVLYVCQRNAGRSQLAACITRHLVEHADYVRDGERKPLGDKGPEPGRDAGVGTNVY